MLNRFLCPGLSTNLERVPCIELHAEDGSLACSDVLGIKDALFSHGYYKGAVLIAGII